MPDEKYWRGRFVQVEQTAHKQAQETLQALDAQYRVAEREIERQMSTWYQRFATNNGIDLREAKRLLNSGELKEFKWSVQDYIKYGREHALNGQWMKELENASARFHVTRLQALQLDCQQTIERLYGGRLDAFDALMKDQYLGGYLHTAFEIQRGIGIGWDIAAIDARALQRVISKPWTMDGKNFSERIWASKAALTSEVQKQLTQNLMLGRAPDQSIKAIADAFNVSRGQSARLVMTESAYFASLSQQDCFNALGVELYQIVATLDERTSETCQAMDGQVFSMKDYSPGMTAPPFHPWCRTVTCPYYADMKGVGERAARDPDTGKTYHVPRDMKYGDWKKTFTEGGTKAGLPPAAIPTTRNYNHDLATKLGQSHFDNMRDLVDKCSSAEMRTAWEKYEADIGVADTHEMKRAHCDWSNNIHVDLAGSAKGNTWEKPYQTVFHESGHAMDMLAGKRYGYSTGTPSPLFSAGYRNGVFPQTIKSEVDAMVTARNTAMKAAFKAHSTDFDWLHKNGYISTWDYDFYKQHGVWVGGTPKYSKAMAYKAIEKEIRALSPFAKSDLSDILEGATREKIQAGFGHGNGYWKNGEWTVATEAFAEMVDSTVTNPESLAAIRQYLPKSYDIFVKMLGEIVK